MNIKNFKIRIYTYTRFSGLFCSNCQSLWLTFLQTHGATPLSYKRIAKLEVQRVCAIMCFRHQNMCILLSSATCRRFTWELYNKRFVGKIIGLMCAYCMSIVTHFLFTNQPQSIINIFKTSFSLVNNRYPWLFMNKLYIRHIE